MPSQQPSASRSRKSLFNVKTLQYAGSLNCVPFQKVEGKAGIPLPRAKGPPLHGRNGIPAVRAPHTRQGRNRAARSDLGLEPLTHGKDLPCSASSGLYRIGVPHTRQGHARLKNRRRPLLTPPHMPKAHRMPWSNPALSGQIAYMPRARRNLWAESPKPSPQRAKGT